MPPITLELLRRRAEHNAGIVSTLEEVSLHGQDIERIELLGQSCRQLRILYLQNNVISRIENLHRLKQLEYVNLALNNITVVESLEGCESLQKLDLTANFIAAPKGLLSVESLAANAALRELFLVGNPCEHSPAFRPFIIASLPQLAKLDGADVTPSERIAAAQALPRLRAALEAEAAVAASDAEGEEAEGWGPAARLREHREEAAVRSAHEAAKRAEAQRTLLGAGGDSGAHRSRAAPPRQALEAMPLDGSLPPQTNEGGWQYSLGESEDGRCVVLSVALGRFLDADKVAVDVSPLAARCLIAGRLLLVHTGEEVNPAASGCQRSATTGALVLTMPKATHALTAAAAAPPKDTQPGGGAVRVRGMVAGAPGGEEEDALGCGRSARRAVHTPLFEHVTDDVDAPPPLSM